MEDDKIPNIIRSLEVSRNKQNVYQNLSSLRRVVTNKEQFTIVLRQGGIRVLTGCLLQKNANLIDSALSILGNCCTERNCAKEVIKHNGLRILSDILKNWCQDTVICRTCRIIGNIAQFDNYASEFYKYGIVPMVVSILNKSTSKVESDSKEKKNKETANKISMGTQVMAVRVLRLLWESYSNRQNMVQDGAVKAVSLVLIRYNEKLSTREYSDSARKQIEKLLESVLKCLLLFSKWGTLECAQQILADGTGFKTLVALINLNPYSAVKCLTNLSHVATSRSDIANAAAVNCIVTIIKDHLDKNSNDRCSNDIVSAFCLFCKHPMNCSEVKKAGGLQLILKVLSHCKSRRQEYQIVNALSCFHFDEQSQEIMLSTGLIKIIIDCLERNLKSKEDLNEKHVFIKKKKRTKLKVNVPVVQKYGKRKRDNSISEEKSPSSPKISCTNEILITYMYSGRMTPPDSDSSTFSSTSGTPPRNDNDIEDDDDSVNYSPVCSDDEQEDIDTGLIKETTSLELETDQESEEEYENDKSHFESSDLQEKAIIMMLVVLSRISHMKPNNPETGLGSKRSLIILLKYLRESRHPHGRITSLLTKIVSNHDNFLQMIESNTIQLIHSLTDPQHDLDCSSCFRMADIGQHLLTNIITVAQSDCGKGQLYNLMQKGNTEDKRQCIINIPLIVKLKPMLLRFMYTWNGLNILINQFVENNDLRYSATTALNNLACSININNPVVLQNSPIVSNLSDKYKPDPESKNIITIKLDDGSILDTDKDFLIEKADYFKVMLTGAFKESNQETIRLKNVSNNALQCLLNLLHGGYQNLPPHKLNIKLSTILEVIVLTDIYLLENLTDWLTRCVEQYSLRVDTVCEIYNWSIESGTNFLRVETVAFVLTATMKDRERYNLFENIIDCGLINEIKDDVQQLISRYLKIR